jgi:hypothetical protein
MRLATASIEKREMENWRMQGTLKLYLIIEHYSVPRSTGKRGWSALIAHLSIARSDWQLYKLGFIELGALECSLQFSMEGIIQYSYKYKHIYPRYV